MAADQVSNALDDMSTALAANAEDERLLVKRIRSLKASHASGKSWWDALASQPDPGVMTLASRTLSRMTAAGSAFRRAMAGALREEGLSIPSIAESFAVSHQRVSALLRDRPTD